MQKRVAKTLIKPVENEDFGVPFSKMAPKMIKKHYLEKVFATRFQNVGKPYKTNGKHGFSKCTKRIAKTLIKPVEMKTFPMYTYISYLYTYLSYISYILQTYTPYIIH